MLAWWWWWWWFWFGGSGGGGGSDLVSRHRHQGRDYMPSPTRETERKGQGGLRFSFLFQSPPCLLALKTTLKRESLSLSLFFCTQPHKNPRTRNRKNPWLYWSTRIEEWETCKCKGSCFYRNLKIETKRKPFSSFKYLSDENDNKLLIIYKMQKSESIHD